MTQARKTQISLSNTPYYHCMGRCVRRAFLCGDDPLTGKSYEHRKQWIVDKLRGLTDIFTIDVCAYAVMSNHYHVVLKVKLGQSQEISDHEVIERWTRLFNGNVLIHRFLKGDCNSQGELDKVQETIDIWRKRLSDISWFMRCLNESIARQANVEDQCSGRFWEGRFKSQALLNEQALLSCMVYVDLNPIRAGIAKALDNSEFTSIEQRLKQFSLELDAETVSEQQTQEPLSNVGGCLKLADFIGGRQIEGIPYSFIDYLELADWTGRAVRGDKVGYILEKSPKILEKLGIDSDIWLNTVQQYSDNFYSHIGTEEQIKAICEQSGKKWLSGIRSCRHLY